MTPPHDSLKILKGPCATFTTELVTRKASLANKVGSKSITVVSYTIQCSRSCKPYLAHCGFPYSVTIELPSRSNIIRKIFPFVGQ